MIQTIGRASRNVNEKAILYTDKISPSMKVSIDETNRRRNKQIKFNEQNNITSQSIIKILKSLSEEKKFVDKEIKKLKQVIKDKMKQLKTEEDLDALIQDLEDRMFMSAKELRLKMLLIRGPKLKKYKNQTK
ncbi:MAG: hypothetical protein ACFFDF_00110 [Candidatus Odinarchaeota archaeon]